MIGNNDFDFVAEGFNCEFLAFNFLYFSLTLALKL